MLLIFPAGAALSRKLVIAKEERDKQIYHFQEIRDTVEKDSAIKWVKEVIAWDGNRTLPNPYELPNTGLCSFFSSDGSNVLTHLCSRWAYGSRSAVTAAQR